ncbi:DMT family transporter [uncultured Jatrophihabitans sp.]|uniref:DMT family transporter n=1 Tax=uncultured Jatrophihabitans sp. TaxID=1610747 RepID=UPI0035C972DC
MWQTLLSYVLAALAAMGNALANVMQRKAGLEAGPDQSFGLRLLWDLVHRPTWLIGFGGLVSSFVLQAIALGLGQLSAVEPIITLEVPLTLLVASRVFASPLGRPEWTGILTMTAGMIALVAFLNPRPGDETNVSHFLYAAAGGSTAATIAALVVVAQRGRTLWRTACLGAAAGTSFGLTATLIKETIAQGEKHGLVGVLTTWQTYTAISFGVLGLVLVQWALHVGPLLAAQPGFTLMDPLVSILWGVLVFGEITRTGAWLFGATLGAVAVGAGVFVLAHSPVLAAVNDAENVAPEAPLTASRASRSAG